MIEKIELDADAQDEIEIRPGLTLTYSETLKKYFVKETLDRLEDLPSSIIKEVDDFLRARLKKHLP